jgi:hypothetical protein
MAGGHKQKWSDDVRREALRLGPERAEAVLGVPQGTTRSWQRRARLRALRNREDPNSGLNLLRAEARALLARSAAERQAARERHPAREPDPEPEPAVELAPSPPTPKGALARVRRIIERPDPPVSPSKPLDDGDPVP